MSDVDTSHAPDRSRFEAHLDGDLAGFAEYQLAEGLIVFTHTEVDESFEGRGVGSALARAARPIASSTTALKREPLGQPS